MMEWDGKGLVSTDWLAANLNNPDLRIFDTTTHLTPAMPGPFRIESGRSDYETGHIPGAAFIDLADELSDTKSPLNFTMPAVDDFAKALGAAGVASGTRVVAYSTTAPMWATRLWWMLRACGFDNAAVLDGGFAKWTAEGLLQRK
jgi:thiosulfate/3-mercaptopyruvate sulfurtransferase